MSAIIDKLVKKQFVKNVIILVTGTAAGQFLNLVFQPIITRLYGPEAYGTMGAFIALIGIITPIAALTYPIAIVLPKKDEEARNLVRLSLLFTLIFSLILLIMIVFLKNQLATLLNLGEVAKYLLLFPIVILFAGIVQVLEQWLIRTKEFPINAKATFYQSLILNITKVGAGLVYPFAVVLVFLSAIANGIRATLMFILIRKKHRKKSLKFWREKVNIQEYKGLVKKYKDFPIYRAPQSLIFAITESLPLLMLSMFFGPAAAGFYSLSRSVMSVPSQLIGKAVGDVFYARISDAGNRNENLTSLIFKATIALAGIALVPFGLVVIIGPWLFSLVFGQSWYTAGEYAQWVALYVFFKFIHQPSMKALPVLNAQAFHLKFTIITLILNLITMSTGYYIFQSDILAISFFALSNSLLSIFLIFFTIKLSKRFDSKAT